MSLATVELSLVTVELSLVTVGEAGVEEAEHACGQAGGAVLLSHDRSGNWFKARIDADEERERRKGIMWMPHSHIKGGCTHQGRERGETVH